MRRSLAALKFSRGRSGDLILWLNPYRNCDFSERDMRKQGAQRPWLPQPWPTLALAPSQSMSEATSVNSFMSFSFFIEKSRAGLLTFTLLRAMSCDVVHHLRPDRPVFKSHSPGMTPAASSVIALHFGFFICKMEIMLVQNGMKAMRFWHQLTNEFFHSKEHLANHLVDSSYKRLWSGAANKCLALF